MIVGIFTSDSMVLEIAVPYLIFNAVGCMIENIIYISTGVVSGAGYTNITMAASMLSAVGRIVIALVIQSVTTLGVYSVGFASIIAPVIPVIIMVYVIISGKWKVNRLQRELDKM